MQTLNGKLIVEEISELDKLKQKMGNVAQQFEHLELQMTTMSEKNQTDYLNRIVSVQLSLQKLERIYSCLLSTTILTAIGLVSWSAWVGFNHNPTPVKQVSSLIALDSTEAAGSR